MSKFLSSLKPPHGAVRQKKRVGRGDSSGHGGTSTRGHKGQKARAGGYHKVGFEGGQMPLYRRLPKRGFTNIFKKNYAIINLEDLQGIAEGTVVDLDYLKSKNLVRNNEKLLKILGDGELNHPITIVADKFSTSAQEKIKNAGGEFRLSSKEKPSK